MLLDHLCDHRFARRRNIGLAVCRKVGHGLLHDVHAQREGSLIEHGQGTHGHAALNPRVFNGGCRNAFAQHGRAFHHEGSKYPAGEKAARVVDHNWNLANGLHIVKSTGYRFVIGLFAANDFYQLHLVHRTEEVDADKFLWCHRGFGQAADRQGGCVGGKESTGFE